MATRGKTTFQKRQKEMARKDKQQRKEERRVQRKLGLPDGGTDDDLQLLSAPVIDPEIYLGDVSIEPGDISRENSAEESSAEKV